MEEERGGRGEMMGVGESECEEYFVLFKMVLCWWMLLYVDGEG